MKEAENMMKEAGCRRKEAGSKKQSRNGNQHKVTIVESFTQTNTYISKCHSSPTEVR